MATDCPEAPTLRERAEFLGLSFAGWVVRRFPFPCLRFLAGGIGTLVFLLDGRGRRVAVANLESAFGNHYTSGQRLRIARSSYATFARTMIELLWSPNLTPERAHRIARVEGLDLDPCHSDPHQPVVYLCLHYSNFEWMSQFSAYWVGAGPVIAQRLRNPLLGNLFDRLRSSTGHKVIPQERAMIRMLKHLKAGGKFSMLCDLNLDPSEASVIIDTFGGLKMCVTQMHAALALRTGAKIIPAECRPEPNGRYRMISHKPLDCPPGTTAAEIVQQCWNILEPSIRGHPEYWLWSYKHWRFRPSNDPSGRYPFYANTAKRFDRLLAKTRGE